MSQVFSLKYDLKINPGKYSEDDLQRENAGGCDAMVVIPIIRGEDGYRDQMLMTIDGESETEGGPISPMELFKTWVTLCGDLIKLEGLPDHLRAFVADVFSQFAQQMHAAKKGDIVPIADSEFIHKHLAGLKKGEGKDES